jgi:predicted permease
MRKSPGTSILAVIILALGVGANTALFTVIDNVLLRPLPYQQSDRIIIINNGSLQPVSVDSWLDYDDFSKRAKNYEAIAALTVDSPVVHIGKSSKLVSAVKTTANLFEVLKIRPVLGRAFTSQDSQIGALPVALVTNIFWRENLNSDPDVIGRQLAIGATPYTVIGVLPSELKFPEFWGSEVAQGIWLPLQVTPEMLTQRNNRFLVMVGRLRPGIEMEAARREAFSITKNMGSSLGLSDTQVAFTVISLKDLIAGDVRPALLALTIAMALVLLIACAGVANLQSARFISRMHEFTVRTALGASRRKLIGQVLGEVSVICTFGAAAGLSIAWILLRLVRLLPQDTLARVEEVHFRWETIAVFAVIVLLTTLISALIPALQTARNHARLTASEGARGSSIGPGKTKVSRWLISGEVALSVVLLISAVLMLRTVLSLRSVTAGFDPQRVTMFWAVPGQSNGFLQNSHNASQISVFTRIYEPMLEQIVQLPGVTSAAFTSSAPLNNVGIQAGFNIVGKSDNYPPVFLRAVSPDYARVLGAPVLRGRMISDLDTSDSQLVAVVNQAFVAQYLGNADPVGRQLELANSAGMTNPYTIIGVLANVVQNEVAQSPAPEVSIAYRQIPPSSSFYGLLVAPQATYVIRTHGNVDVMPAIRALFTAKAPEMALDSVQTLEAAQYNNTFRQRLGFYLIAGFAGMAVLLVVAGLYGVLSQLVGQRRREIAVRMALGATRSEILGLIGKQGLAMIAAGLAAGFIVSLAFGRFIASFLYGVKPTDVLSYVAVLVILLLVGCAATLVPAYRASRMEPADSLRME